MDGLKKKNKHWLSISTSKCM